MRASKQLQGFLEECASHLANRNEGAFALPEKARDELVALIKADRLPLLTFLSMQVELLSKGELTVRQGGNKLSKSSLPSGAIRLAVLPVASCYAAIGSAPIDEWASRMTTYQLGQNGLRWEAKGSFMASHAGGQEQTMTQEADAALFAALEKRLAKASEKERRAVAAVLEAHPERNFATFKRVCKAAGWQMNEFIGAL